MHIFMTGATGTLGAPIARALRARGHELTALCSTQTGWEQARALGYRAVLGNMVHGASWRNEAASADALVHCAMEPRVLRGSRLWLEQATESERAALSNLILAAEAGGRCRALIDTSGIAVYGDQGEALVDEDSPCRPSALGDHHRAGEHLTMAAAADGLPACSLRVGFVYAPSGPWARGWLDRAARGSVPIIGDGHNWTGPIHLDDLGALYAAAVERCPAGRVVNAVDDRPMRMQDLAEATLAAFAGGRVRHLPPRVVGLVAGAPIAELACASVQPSNALARDILDWEPRYPTFDAGLPAVVEAWRGLQRG